MKLLITLLSCFVFITVYSQKFEETVTRKIEFEKKDPANVLMIANINGEVKVEGYQGNEILLEMKKSITAKTEGRLQAAKEELSLGVSDRYDTIIVYIKGPCGNFNNYRKGGSKRKNSWGYNWNNCEYTYDFTFDMTLKVPKDQKLYVSTVNDGDIEISNVDSNITARNVNGGIFLKGLKGGVNARTINGDVNLEYLTNPGVASHYYTLNGDINAEFVKGLSANVSFKSYNGDLFTDIEDLKYKPTVIQKDVKKGDGIKYKIGESQAFQTRSGGVELDFETFNGDVYLKENN